MQTRGHRGPLIPFRRPANQGYRMDRITCLARCNNREVFFLCPVTRVLKPLHRVQ